MRDYKLTNEVNLKKWHKSWHYTVIFTSQPLFSWFKIFSIILRHPKNLKVVGIDTALFNWQIARKLHWYKLADKIRGKVPETLAFCGDHYEVHK